MRPGAALLLALTGASLGCRSKTAAQVLEPRQLLEGLSMSQSTRGAVDWSLKARSAVLREDAKLAELTEPRMEFLKNGKVVSRVSSLRGIVRTDTHDVVLSTGVVLDAIEDRSVLKTETLDYSSKTRLFTTQADILVTRPDGVLRGRGLEAKPDLSEIRIFNQQSVIKGKPQ
ncbi:MAG: LPS export ABC transporter periplasmic protein LptC [Elusimicrobiota bacterium]